MVALHAMVVCMEACTLDVCGLPHARKLVFSSVKPCHLMFYCFAVLHSSYEDWQRFLCDVEPFPGDGCEQL